MPSPLRLLVRLLPLCLAINFGFHAHAQTATLEAYLHDPQSINSRTYGGIVRSPAGTPTSPDGRTTEHPTGTTIRLTCPSGTDVGQPLTFLGWAPTDYSPDTGFAAANTQNPRSITLDASRRLAAYNGFPIATALETPGRVWRSGGHALWVGGYDVFSPAGRGTARAATLRAAGEETYLETEVAGPALAGFSWRLDASTGTVSTLELLTGGSASLAYTSAGANISGWKKQWLDIPAGAPTTLRFRLRRTTTSSLFPNPLGQESAYLGDFAVGQRSAPVNLRATSNAVSGQGFATIRWTAGFGAESHRVELATDSAFTAIIQSAEVAATSSEHTFYSLDTATRYHYRVTALANGHAPLVSAAPPPSFVPDGRQEQTIQFAKPADRPLGAPAFVLSATATSGLPVAFAVTGVATLGDDGKTLTLTGSPGVVTITATQAGNGSYSAAPAVIQTLEVTPGPATTPQKITFAQPAGLTYGQGPITLVATASSGLPVAFDVSGPADLDADGVTLRITGAGKVVVKATQPGAHPYKPAAAVTRAITIQKADLAVSFANVTRLVGEANPTFEPNYTGFVAGDTVADLAAATRPRGVTKATIKSPQGDYPITFTGGSDTNYRFVPGAPASITVRGFGGTYEALLVDEALTPAGKLTLTIANNAFSFSGTLATAREGVTGSFKSSGTKILVPASDASSASVSDVLVTVAGTAYNLDLTVSATGGVTGDWTGDGIATGTLAHGARVVTFAKSETAPGFGANTLVLHPAVVLFDEDQGPVPAGSGHATAAISKTGVLALKGMVADGSPLTASLKLTRATPADNSYVLWTNPYGKRAASFLAGALTLQGHPDQTRFAGRFHIPSDAGLLIWRKAALPGTPKTPDKSYRSGFGPLGVQVSLDPWLPPVTKISASAPSLVTLAQRLGLSANATTPAELDVAFGPDGLDFGASADELPAVLALSIQNALAVAEPVTTPVNATTFTIKTTLATGAFTGSLVLSDQVNPPPAKPTTRKVSFSGTLRQAHDDTLLGAGFFLLPAFDKNAEQPSGNLRLTEPTPAP